MSLAFQNSDNKEYGTKTDVHYRYKVAYVKITEAIKDGRLAVHLREGRIWIDMEEAKAVFGK
jgi:hypothetical protein